jgi:hypothetical protein
MPDFDFRLTRYGSSNTHFIRYAKFPATFIGGKSFKSRASAWAAFGPVRQLAAENFLTMRVTILTTTSVGPKAADELSA